MSKKSYSESRLLPPVPLLDNGLGPGVENLALT